MHRKTRTRRRRPDRRPDAGAETGRPPLTPEQRAEWQRRLASDPNYKPSAYWPL